MASFKSWAKHFNRQYDTDTFLLTTKKWQYNMDTFLLTTKNRQYNMDTFFQLEKNGFIFQTTKKMADI